MPPDRILITIDGIFDAVLRIQLIEERRIDIQFTPGTMHVRFPTTRRLAEFLEIPHYYVLPYFAMMEEQSLVTRSERIGIMTTGKGTMKYFELCMRNYQADISGILGPDIYRGLHLRAMSPPPAE